MAALILIAALVAAGDDPPLVYYNFDAGAGDQLVNHTGDQHHGTITGAKWHRTPLGHGLTFDGKSDHVDLGKDPALRLTTSFTIELWARHNRIEGWQDYVGNYVGGTSGYVIAQNNGYLYFHHGGLSPYIVETEPILEAGEWHHIAAVYDRDGGALRIYVDGREQAVQQVTGDPKPTPGLPVYLGRYNDGRERFHGVMDELRIWPRALSEAELMARFGEQSDVFKPDRIEITPPPLPEDVLMGMKLERVKPSKAGFQTVTTGARIGWAGRAIGCTQRIPNKRVTMRILLERYAPVTLEARNDFACRLNNEDMDVEIHGDSVIILRAKRTQRVGFQGLFKPEYQTQHQGRHLFIDETGGFGVYPVIKRDTPTPDFRKQTWSFTWTVKRGEEIWVSIFPPRPYNHQRSFESLAHEGMVDKPRWYPSDKLIEDTAKLCKVLTIHSYIFPGGEKAPWMIPRFHPVDIDKWHEVRGKIQSHGMKVIPYFSPFYYKGSFDLTEGGEQRTYFDEIRHAIDELKVDGIYFDGVSMDFRKSYTITRKVRKMIGDDRVLYVHCSSDPLGKPSIYCPFIDTYADYILRGEAGRAKLGRDKFLRWIISSYNIGNAVGLWCYYGSTGAAGYRHVVPTRDDIDACLKAHARLWRQGMAWEAASVSDLARFDQEYYNKVEQLRREHQEGTTDSHR